MGCSPPGSYVHGILLAKILKWVAMPSSGESSWTKDQASSPALQADSLPSEPPGKPTLCRALPYIYYLYVIDKFRSVFGAYWRKKYFWLRGWKKYTASKSVYGSDTVASSIVLRLFVCLFVFEPNRKEDTKEVADGCSQLSGPGWSGQLCQMLALMQLSPLARWVNGRPHARRRWSWGPVLSACPKSVHWYPNIWIQQSSRKTMSEHAMSR